MVGIDGNVAELADMAVVVVAVVAAAEGQILNAYFDD